MAPRPGMFPPGGNADAEGVKMIWLGTAGRFESTMARESRTPARESTDTAPQLRRVDAYASLSMCQCRSMYSLRA